MGIKGGKDREKASIHHATVKTQEACSTTHPRLINNINCMTLLGGWIIVIRKWPACPVTN
jgi:hypothetical protein